MVEHSGAQSVSSRGAAGATVFLLLSFLGSWFVAAGFRALSAGEPPVSLESRLLATSAIYAVTMGWQPLLATWVVLKWIDPSGWSRLGLAGSRPVFSAVGGAAALALPILAMALSAGAAELDLLAKTSLNGSVTVDAGERGLPQVGALVVALAVTVLLVWFQSLTEEIGWRGYFLPVAMGALGRFPGLFVHGLVWGAWYGPVLFFASYGEQPSSGNAARCVAFVVGCALVGVLLGWLRLASKSVVPGIVANSTLTLMSGLPYVTAGVDTGLRSAIFWLPGWVVVAAAIGVLGASRWRDAVRVPMSRAVSGHPVVLVVRLLRGSGETSDGQQLH